MPLARLTRARDDRFGHACREPAMALARRGCRRGALAGAATRCRGAALGRLVGPPLIGGRILMDEYVQRSTIQDGQPPPRGHGPNGGPLCSMRSAAACHRSGSNAALTAGRRTIVPPAPFRRPVIPQGALSVMRALCRAGAWEQTRAATVFGVMAVFVPRRGLQLPQPLVAVRELGLWCRNDDVHRRTCRSR